MLLIIVLGLIAQVALVSGVCGNWTSKVKVFDWNKVGMIVLTLFLKQAAVIIIASLYIFLCFLTNFHYSASECSLG